MRARVRAGVAWPRYAGGLRLETPMKASLAVALLMSLSLSACREDAPGDSNVAPDASEASAPPAQAPASAPRSDTASAPAVDAAATFLGYGGMRLGSGVADARQAWAGELEGSPGEPGGCHYLTPNRVANSSEPAFMIEGDRFVRYDVGTAEQAAPGGGKVGMTAEELGALYGAMESLPHKYVEGGRYLSIFASGVAPTRLVFEIDATGTVTSWRVGLVPQVDYVEGCS